MTEDAITCACLKGLTDVVSCLLSAAKADIRREIEADELLGCNFVQEKNVYNGRRRTERESRIIFQCPIQNSVQRVC